MNTPMVGADTAGATWTAKSSSPPLHPPPQHFTDKPPFCSCGKGRLVVKKVKFPPDDLRGPSGDKDKMLEERKGQGLQKGWQGSRSLTAAAALSSSTSFPP